MPKEKPDNEDTITELLGGEAEYQVELLPRQAQPATLERRHFIDGMLKELDEEMKRYVSLVRQTSDLQGRLAIAERNLRLSREYLKVIMGETGEEVPGDCQKVLNRIRFVGTRLGDACLQILQDKRSVTSQEMLDELNSGQFRFRTGSPLREINAALLRQPRAKRDGDRWMYVPKSKRRRGEVA